MYGGGTLLLKGEHITKQWHDKVILDDVSFIIEKEDCIGIVGKNGAGKTTLVDIITENIMCEKGVIVKGKKELSIGYLKQTAKIEEDFGDEMISFLHVASQLHLPKHAVMSDEISDYLSGGEKTKVALAELWTKHYDLLILDEPTNNMDESGVAWLIQQIKQQSCTCIIISHDRYFLDQVVSKIFELEHNKLHLYYGNYTDYKREKRRQTESQMDQYIKEVKDQKKIDAQIQNLRQWSDKAHRLSGKQGTLAERRQAGLKEFQRVKAKKMDKQVKSREKLLLKMKDKHVKKPVSDNIIKLRSQNVNIKGGRRITDASNITKRYGDYVLFEKSSFYIQRGEKIGIIGHNGVGKTTLIRMLQGEEKPDAGYIKMIDNVDYLRQEISDIDASVTIENLLNQYDRQTAVLMRNELALFGFAQERLKQSLATFSLGERMRFKIIQAILEKQSVLILDEPTNHLDVQSREQLEQLLAAYTGTLLLVSHDRYLIESVCDRLLLIQDKQIKRLEYTLAEYEMRQKKQDTQIAQKIEQNQIIYEFKRTALLSRLALCDVNSKEYEALALELEMLNE